MFCACCSADPGFVTASSANGGRPVPGLSALRRRERYVWRSALSASPSRLPPRADVVFRNARLVTMDPFLGDMLRGDILVSDGLLLAVEPEVEETGAIEINADGLTIVPGLVHTGRDSLAAALGDLFVPVLEAGMRLSPERVYRLLRANLLGCLQKGFTTVHQLASPLFRPACGDAAILAQADCGLRGRLSFPATGSNWRNDLEKLRDDWFCGTQAHLLDLGMVCRSRGVDGAPGDMLTAAAVARGEHVHLHDASLRALTVEAASFLEMDDRIGSLTPGKRGDLLVLRSPETTRGPHVGPQTLLRELRGKGVDVAAVMVDGRLLKNDGKLAFLDDDVVAREAGEELAALRRRVSPAEKGTPPREGKTSGAGAVAA